MGKTRPAPWTPPKKFIVQEQEWVTIESDAMNDLGLCDRQHCKVTLNSDLGPETIGETWFHELLHACWASTNLTRDEEKEEQVVMALSPILWAALRRNRLRFD